MYRERERERERDRRRAEGVVTVGGEGAELFSIMADEAPAGYSMHII